MARIAGINVPNEKRIIISLTYIYGIGKTRANKILKEVDIDKNKRTKDLTEGELDQIRKAVAQFRVEGDLRRESLTNVRRLKTISSYRGLRHSRHLPVRGQRTKTNSRTVRGNVRRTMGSGKIKAAAKT